MTLMLGKGVDGVSDTVMKEVGKCIMYWIGKWWQRMKDLLYGEPMEGILVLFLPTPLYEQMHMHYYYYHIFLTDLFVN